MQKETLTRLKKWGKQLGRVISLLSIIFIVYAVYKLGFDFNSITNWPLFLFISLICIVIKVITVFVSSHAWAVWLRLFAGKPIDTIGAVCVYTKANIGKYLPGNVMHYVERNMFASNLNISQKKIAFCSVIEIACLVLSGFITAMLLSYQQLFSALTELLADNTIKLLGIMIGVVLIIFILIVIIMRKKIAAWFADYKMKDVLKTILITLLHYIFVIIALGIVMVILYIYMGGTVTWENGSLIVSGYIIAWVLGFIIPGAPGGIGVRELVITLLLGPVVGTEVVLTLSVIHRLITIVGDFLAYLIEILVLKKA